MGIIEGDAVESAEDNGKVIEELPAKVTAAIARPRPTITDEEPYVIDTLARIVPWKLLEYPIVALEPIAQ